MEFKKAKMAAVDITEANNILLDELNLEDIELDLSRTDMSLTPQDLLIKNSANLFMLSEVKDFSNELLEMISAPKITDFAVEAPKAKVISIDDKIGRIQQEVMADITQPLSTMFDEFANIIAENIA